MICGIRQSYDQLISSLGEQNGRSHRLAELSNLLRKRSLLAREGVVGCTEVGDLQLKSLKLFETDTFRLCALGGRASLLLLAKGEHLGLSDAKVGLREVQRVSSPLAYLIELRMGLTATSSDLVVTSCKIESRRKRAELTFSPILRLTFSRA